MSKKIVTAAMTAVWIILLVALYIIFPIANVYTGDGLSTYEIIPSVLFFAVGIVCGIVGAIIKSKPLVLLSLIQELMAIVCIVLLGIFIFTENATVLFVFLNIANPFAFLPALHGVILFFALAALQIILPLASYIFYRIKNKNTQKTKETASAG